MKSFMQPLSPVGAVDANMARAEHGASIPGVHATHMPPALRHGASRLKSRAGATLIEMTVVLLIIIGIIVAALAIADGTMRQASVTNEVQTLTNLSGAVFKTKSTNGFPTTASDIMQAMSDMQVVPSNINKTGTGSTMKLFNGWGGAITIQATNGGGTFSITYAQVPKSDCVQLLLAAKPGILQSVGSGTTATKNMIDLLSSDGSTMCSAATNTLTWDSQTL